MADNTNKDAAGATANGAAEGATVGGPYGALIGGGVGLIGSLIGSSKSAEARKAAAAEAARKAALWAGVRIPTIAEQSIILQTPDLMGQYSPEQLQTMQQDQSSIQNAQASPEVLDAQNKALQGISEVAKGGVTEADLSAQREMERGISQQNQARQNAVLNAMAQRGTLGSGMELAAKLQGNQQAAEAASTAGENLTQQAQARALQAMTQQGSLAGSMRGQQFGEQQAKSQAQDAINRFNVENRQNVSNANVNERNTAQKGNLAMLQAQENLRAQNANEAQKANKNLYQTQFQNQMAKTSGQTGAGGGWGTTAANLNQQANNEKNMFGSVVSGITQGYNAGKKGELGFVDGGLVTAPELQDQLPQLPDQTQPVDTSQYNFPIPAGFDKTQAPIPPVTTPPAVPTVLDPRAEAAMNERDSLRSKSALLNTFLGAMEGSGNGTFKADRSAVNALNQQAETPMEKYKALVAQEAAAKAGKQAQTEEQRKAETHKAAMTKSDLDIAQQKMDQSFADSMNTPGTPASTALAEATIRKNKQLGIDIPEDQIRGMSGKQITAAFPHLQEDLKAAAEKSKEESDRVYKEKMLQETIASRKDIAQLNSNEKANAAKEKEQAKTSENDNKDAMKLNEALDKGWAARGGQAGQVQAKINAAEAAQAIIDQGKTQGGGLDSRQIEELAQSTSRLIGGNAQASARIEALIPHTLLGRTQTLKEYLTSNPQGQEMQSFVSRLEETIKRENAIANRQKQEYQLGLLSAHARLRKSNPDLFNSILQSKGIDPNSLDEHGNVKRETKSEKPLTGPYGDTTVKDNKQYKWNSEAGKYQLIGP